MDFHGTTTLGRRTAQRNEWFEQRRDLFIREMLDSFFGIVRSFEEIYSVYIHSCPSAGGSCVLPLIARTGDSLERVGSLLTRDVGTEATKGPLWQLKDLCHQLWPEHTAGQEPGGSLVDWFVGSVFHEAMKLKENVYMLNNYGPASHRIHECPVDRGFLQIRPADATISHFHALNVEKVVRRTCADVQSQMEQISFLLGKANHLLRLMAPSLARKPLVVRLLAERENDVMELWGETVEELFAEMFNGDAAEGFCAAGRSYQSGQWYYQALKMYQRALAIDHTSNEALIKTHQLQAIVKENGKILGVA